MKRDSSLWYSVDMYVHQHYKWVLSDGHSGVSWLSLHVQRPIKAFYLWLACVTWSFLSHDRPQSSIISCLRSRSRVAILARCHLLANRWSLRQLAVQAIHTVTHTCMLRSTTAITHIKSVRIDGVTLLLPQLPALAVQQFALLLITFYVTLIPKVCITLRLVSLSALSLS